MYFSTVHGRSFGSRRYSHTSMVRACKLHTNPQTQTLVRLHFPLTVALLLATLVSVSTVKCFIKQGCIGYLNT